MKPIWFVVAVALLAFAWWRRRRAEPPLLVGLGLVAIGAAVYGTGLVEMPDLEKLLTDLGEALGTWTYLLVGLLCFLESGAGIGLLIPGETAIIVGGVVAGQGEINIVLLIAIAWATAVAGDLTSFYIGRRLGREFLVKHGPRFKIDEPKIETRRGVLRPPRRQGRLPRPLRRPRARGLAVRRRLLRHAAAALPALRRARRRHHVHRLLAARLPLLALARQSPEDRQTGHARARHRDHGRRRDRRRRPLAARREQPRQARRLDRDAVGEARDRPADPLPACARPAPLRPGPLRLGPPHARPARPRADLAAGDRGGRLVRLLRLPDRARPDHRADDRRPPRPALGDRPADAAG